MAKKIRKPIYLYRSLDFAMDVVKFYRLMLKATNGPIDGDEIRRIVESHKHTFEAAKDVIEWEDKERLANGLSPIFGGHDE